MSTLSTKATIEELAAGIKDEFGVVYSADGKRLLKCENDKIEQYEIKEGTEVICDEAFEWCEALRQIIIPDSITNISMSAFNFCNYLEHIIISKKSVEKFKEMLPEELWDKLYCLKKAVEDEPKKDNYSSTRRIDEKDDLPF